MNTQAVDTYLANNRSMFPEDRYTQLREHLLALPDERWSAVTSIPLKKPMMALLLAVVLAPLGGEQFYLGRTMLGVAKALTCGFGGVWSIISIFTCTSMARKINFKHVMNAMSPKQ